MKQILSKNECAELKKQILDKYKNQSLFCAIVGYEPSLLSKILNGSRKISSTELNKWREILKCDLKSKPLN